MPGRSPLKVTAPPTDQDTWRLTTMSWEQVNGQPPRVLWRKKLIVFGLMYLSLALTAIAWNRLVDPRYDWTLILAMVGIMAVFAAILRRQQREMRKRLVRSKKI